MDLTNEERERLKAFRVVARQVRESSVIDRGLRVEVRIVGPVGEGPHTLEEETLPEEAFRSLALAIRLVYLKKQVAHFYRVCNVLRKEFQEHRRVKLLDRMLEIRARYKRTVEGTGTPKVPSFEIVVGDQLYGQHELFGIWLNGVGFHQDPEKRREYEKLGKLWRLARVGVQKVALEIAGCVLDLDDVVADFLEEERVPRI